MHPPRTEVSPFSRAPHRLNGRLMFAALALLAVLA